jgi:putative hemolysin
MEDKKFIVIREVIAKKNPKLLKWIPGFLLRYIERIVHEDDINQVMQNIGHLEGMDFVDALITQELQVKVELRGAENISLSGGAVFASNHPLGGLDGIAFMHALGKYRKDIKFLVNDILMNIKNLGSLFIPINKHGGQARDAMRAIDETYASDQAMLVFPAGLVSRKRKNGIIKDLEWKKSFISKAKKYKKDIIPVFIDGRNSDFFYNLARFRKNIGIGANIEMFYLADEMFAQKGKKVTIVVGKPISYSHFDNAKTEQEWAEEVKKIVYAMA